MKSNNTESTNKRIFRRNLRLDRKDKKTYLTTIDKDITKLLAPKLDMGNPLFRLFPIIRLLTKDWIRGFYGPFFSFAFPLILLVVIGNAFGPKAINVAFPGILAASITSIALQGLPITLVEYRKSSLIKRIATTPLKRKDFLISILFWYMIIIIAAALWMHLWAFIFFNQSFNFSEVNWGLAILTIIIFIATSVSIGLFITAVSRTTNMASVIGMLIYLPSAFLAGQFIPLNTIDGSQFLKIVSYFFPFRYVSEIMTHFYSPYTSPVAPWYDWVVPFLSIGIFTTLAIWKFKWE